MKANTTGTNNRETAAQRPRLTRQRASEFQPDCVDIARAQAAILKLLAKAILESHNKSIRKA